MARKPQLILSSLDLDRIEALLAAIPSSAFAGKAELQAIGAGALNQAIKAIAIARGFVAPHGMDLVCVPAFIDIVIDGEERTAIKLLVTPR